MELSAAGLPPLPGSLWTEGSVRLRHRFSYSLAGILYDFSRFVKGENSGRKKQKDAAKPAKVLYFSQQVILGYQIFYIRHYYVSSSILFLFHLFASSFSLIIPLFLDF